MNLLVFSDDIRKVAECVTAAKTLANGPGMVAVLVVGSNANDLAHLLSGLGPDRIYAMGDRRLDGYDPEVSAILLERIVREMKFQGVLLGGTRRGREVGARLATKLKVGCASDCTSLVIQDGLVYAERTVYGGKGTARVRFTSYPFVVTVANGYFGKPDAVVPAPASIEDYRTDLTFGSQITKVQTRKSGTTVDLASADKIVSVGRAFRRKEDLEMAEDLARLLKGAIGCSRPISADFAWLSEEHQVGLSGRVVKPKLYLALGISGQIQHLVGIRHARTIIAVNNDPTAPIADASDYFVESDVYDFVPALIDALRRSSG